MDGRNLDPTIYESRKLGGAMEKEKNEKDYGKLQWFFFVILIPILFAITLSMIILTVAGINVFELASKYKEKVPVVSSIIKDDEDERSSDSIYALRATVEEQKATLESYQSEIEKKDAEIESLQAEIDALLEQIDDILAEQEETAQSLKKVADIYTTMSAKNAAAILSELDEDELLPIFKEMKTSDRAAILEKMEPTKAANITRLLTETSEQTNESI